MLATWVVLCSLTNKVLRNCKMFNPILTSELILCFIAIVSESPKSNGV